MKIRFVTLIQMLSILCVFGLGLATIVATGADDVADALGVDRTVDIDENVDVSLPEVTVSASKPVAGLASRMVAVAVPEDNCGDTPTSINGLIGSVN